MTRNQILSNYFTLTQKDRTGIITIISLICLVSISPRIIEILSSKRHLVYETGWISALKQLETKELGNQKEMPAENEEALVTTYQFDKSKTSFSDKSELFFFDPNSASDEEWHKLGLRDRTITTIQNYLSKGGSFKKPEDLKKIYGLHSNEYERLAPFIRITEKKNLSESSVKSETKFTESKRPYSTIDINTADTSSFIALPGIGSKLAVRIVNFREKLGGFYSVEQIAETYGLPDSTFQKINPYLELGASSIKKINLNTATLDDLKAHPYIKYNVANAIIAYRNQHGYYSKVEDIKKVMIVTEELYNKISLYLTAQ